MVSDTPSSVIVAPSAMVPRLVLPERARLDADPDRMRQAADQRGRRADLQDLAVVHDRYPVAERLRLVHVVRGEHHRAALRSLMAAQQVPQVAAGLRVQRPDVGSSRNTQVGAVHQRARDRQPLRLAAGELLGAGRRPCSVRPTTSSISSARLAPGRRSESANVRSCSRAVSRSKNDDACSCTPMRGSSAGFARPRRLSRERVTSPPSGSRRPFDDLQGGGLARAVRAEDAEELAVADLERHPSTARRSP